MKFLNRVLAATLLLLAAGASQAIPTHLVTNSTWEQSANGTDWSPADAQVDTPTQDWLYPNWAGPLDTVYFRKVFDIVGVAGYGVFHYYFGATFSASINGVQFTQGGCCVSAGVIISDYLQVGTNELLITMTPIQSDSPFADRFTGDIEADNAYDHVTAVPEPDTYPLVLTAIGLLAAVTRRRKLNAVTIDR